MDSSSTSVLREGSDAEREPEAESEEQKEARLQCISERLAAESEQQREARLERMSALRLSSDSEGQWHKLSSSQAGENEY